MLPLKVLLLSDGRPGHFRLAEGVLSAIARRRSLDVSRIEVRRGFVPSRVHAALLNLGLTPRALFRLAYGFSASSLPPADLVVSAGGTTLAGNVAAARILEAPNIFYGSLRKFRARDFSLVLTSHERNATGPRQRMTLKPSPFDPDRIQAPGTAMGEGGHPVWGLLVGGETREIRYGPADWDGLIAFLRRAHGDAGIRWIVSNSPRTPAAASAALALLADEPQGPIAKFIDVRSAGTGSLSELFAMSAAVLCTIDSSTMLSEAVWARRPVIAVAPAETRLDEPEKSYRAYLETNNLVRSIPISELAPDRIRGLAGEITPLDINPLDQLAKLIFEVLPELGGASH